MTQTANSKAQPAKQATVDLSPASSVGLDGPVSKLLEIRMELQSMQVLLTVLANVARLGCAIRHVAAANNVVDLGLGAPAHVAHRVQSCLAQIIGVRAISAQR